MEYQLRLPFDEPYAKYVTRVYRTDVRPLRSQDQVPDMLRLCAAFAAECDPDTEYSELCTRVTINGFLDSPRHDYTECWLVYNSEHRAVGYLLASIELSLYSRAKYARQDLWYVLPRYRGGSATLKLLRTCEQWAHDKGATKLYTGSTNTANVRLAEKTLSTLARLGYTHVGSVMKKDVADE